MINIRFFLNLHTIPISMYSLRIIIAQIYLMLVASISGCCFVKKFSYTPDVYQGNWITESMISHLRPGMTPNEVQSILGTPVFIKNSSDYTQWIYLHFIYKNSGISEKLELTICFKEKHLVRWYTTN